MDRNGWLTEARDIPSPNFNQRPPQTKIDCIIIHGISLPEGVFGGNDIQALFLNNLDSSQNPAYESLKKLQVSSHFLIRRTGELIQFVNMNKRAWHAGESFFQGKSNCNDFSIGIELEGTDDIDYELEQYHQLSHLIAKLKQLYPEISNDRIVGHNDIAPDRKTDPGPAFDWEYSFNQLALIEQQSLKQIGPVDLSFI